ncbi:hypothetical protein CR159_20985 [Pollutimonas subterranea]|uniref:Antitoxin Xre/MbcA/ParS-like toxin-binding domain-containing protein n=1 Tax=Pollutimonas subterranea TaxID=2045210 RepID=A0A2N4TYS1_9BURK|nr:hypothetical protein [Pollutimonas subterranea]PLC47917.1 hypothetical protein CR159_20985 [Pollutimonas subterranea]
MDNQKPLKQLILEANALEARAADARCAAVTIIRSQDPELSKILDDLLPTVADQADWLFKKSFRREERPVDLFISGHALELRDIAGAILHGTYL